MFLQIGQLVPSRGNRRLAMEIRAARRAIFTVLMVATPASPALAQEAGESAVLNAGTAGQVSAERSLGSAMSRSISGAANAVAMAQGGQSPVRHMANFRAGHPSYTIPPNIDPLAQTDAPTYRIATGAVMRVSGGIQPSPTTFCIANCSDTVTNWR